MQKLGKLKKVDLRTYWKSEDRDFTPWLAEEENIKELSDAIGIDLEVEQVEQRIRNFNCDEFSNFASTIENVDSINEEILRDKSQPCRRPNLINCEAR